MRRCVVASLWLSFLLALPAVAQKLSVQYVTAVEHWLHGRQAVAKQELRELADGPASLERDAARTLLLEEHYFWTGQYADYLKLADSLNYQPYNYELAKKLVTWSATQYQLTGDSASVSFRLKRRGHAVVDVFINGKRCRLIVDSGAQRTFLSNRFVHRLGLTEMAIVSASNYNGKIVPARQGRVDSLILGGLTVRHLPIVQAPLPIPGVDGLLGWDVMRQFALRLDYAARRLTIIRSRPMAVEQSANLLGSSVPLLLMQSATGKPLLIKLDTGDARALSISPRGLTKIGSYTLGRKLTVGSAVGQLVRVAFDPCVQSVRVGIAGQNRHFRRARLFRADEIVGQVVMDGLIGGGAFYRGCLFLDAPNHRFTYSE